MPGVVLFLCTSLALLITSCMIVSEEYRPHPRCWIHLSANQLKMSKKQIENWPNNSSGIAGWCWPFSWFLFHWWALHLPRRLNQVVAIQQMWTLCHPSDQMEVARNFDIHLIHATLFLFLVDGIYGTLLFFRALLAKILLGRPITIRLYANLHLKFVLERASNIMILTT